MVRLPIDLDFKNQIITYLSFVIFVNRAPDDVEILKRMQVDQHKDIVLKCFAGVRETLILKSKDEFDVTKIVVDRLKGSLE